jgi:GNAT superfamily N-acetyltransferase
VDDDLRLQGVGSLLVLEAVRWATAHGCWGLASDAKLDNVLSHRLHEGAGFEEVEPAAHYRKKLW